MSARTNDFELRREAEATPLGRLIDGEPGFLIHPMGGYRFQRVQVSGDERYHDKPEKNAYSHPCEAGQSLALGMGEGDAGIGRPDRGPRRFTIRQQVGWLA